METKKILTILVLALGLILCQAKVSEAEPMGTAWTYQGRLMDASKPADGEYNFQFKLFDDPWTGSLIAGPVYETSLNVVDGYFTVELDFGSDVFNGNEVWLETTVAHGDGSDSCTLSPRQKITPTPYALQTRGIFVDDVRYIDYNTWTAKESIEFGRDWQSVAMSADGTKQTAVVDAGQIYVSTDSGNTWTAKESNRQWWSVAMSADGTKQTAVVYNGKIYVSTDSGNTWTVKESIRDWQSVAMSADGTKQTAVVSWGQIYISTDSGNTWTAKESDRAWMSVAMSADGTKQTAVDITNITGNIHVSTDSGNTWTAKESNRDWQSVAMSADGTKQTAVVWMGQIYVSTDSGNTWTAKESNRRWQSVAMSADGTKQTAVVMYGQIYVSMDSGNTWTAIESDRDWFSVAMSADGTKQTAVVEWGQIYVCSADVSFEYNVIIGTPNPDRQSNLIVYGPIFNPDAFSTALAVNFSRDVQVLESGRFGFLPSSKRYKENIAPLEDNFSKILAAQPVAFVWKESKESDIGLIAEDIDELGLRNLVIYDAEGRPESVRYKFLSLYLLEVLKDLDNSIKELKAENESLKKQLKAENESLKRRLVVLEKMMEQVQFGVAKEVQQ